MKTKNPAAAGFTLLELTVAAGLMSIIMIMLYTIFSSAGNIFSGADARIEIFQTARAVFDTLQRDLQGCVVDANGNIFRGWNRAYSYSSAATTAPLQPGMTAQASMDIPPVPSATTISNADPFKKLLSDASNSGGVQAGSNANEAMQICNEPDMVWFRTTTEASNWGVPTEVIYRLGRNFVLEKGVSRQLTNQDIGSTSLGGSSSGGNAAWASFIETRFTFTPIGFNVREFQLRYYRADVVNLDMNSRATSSHWLDYWPAQDTIDTTGTGASTSYYFDCLAGRRARIPAAVQVTLRIADSGQHEWTDYYSSNIIDGRDQPLPPQQFLGYASTGDPVDGIKQTNVTPTTSATATDPAYYGADEVGMMFREVIFIPTYLNALGLKRSDL